MYSNKSCIIEQNDFTEVIHMENIFFRSFIFIFVIFLGFILKKINFYEKTDYKLITKTVINIVMPAVIITSFSKLKSDSSLFFLIFLGIICNLIMLLLGYIFTKNKSDNTKSLFMLNLQGYNIGSFALPFVQNILGPFGVVAVCMFDIGNSILCTGGSYAITSSVIQFKTEKLSIKDFLKKLFSSIPFITYITMIIITELNVKISDNIISLTSFISSANGFLSMLMIGMMFEMNFKSEYLKTVGKILIIRYTAAIIMSYIFYMYLPLSLELKKIIVIILFAPISFLAPIFTEKCNSDVRISSFISFITIIISIISFTILFNLFKI